MKQRAPAKLRSDSDSLYLSGLERVEGEKCAVARRPLKAGVW